MNIHPIPFSVTLTESSVVGFEPLQTKLCTVNVHRTLVADGVMEQVADVWPNGDSVQFPQFDLLSVRIA